MARLPIYLLDHDTHSHHAFRVAASASLHVEAQYENKENLVSAERSGRIHRDEWPKIRTRREQGESLAAIGRDYGVTGSAISQILKKGAADAALAAKPEQSEQDVEPPAPAGPAAPEQPSPEARPDRTVTTLATPEVAERLNQAAEACSQLIINAAPHAWNNEAERAIKAAPAPALSSAQSTSSAQSGDPAPSAGAGGSPSAPGLIEGKVKFFTRSKGFGFVVPDGGGAEIYVSMRALQKSGIQNLVAQQRVRVAVADSNRGPEADRIELVAA